jgi:hypothetical protein
MHGMRSTPEELYFSAPDTHFCYRLSKTQGLVRQEGSARFKKLLHLIGSRSHNPLTFSIASQTSTLLHGQYLLYNLFLILSKDVILKLNQ